MKVLKFGGSSVGSIERIDKVVQILENKLKETAPLFVIFSAYGGVTDQLIRMGELAANGQEEYKSILEELELYHLTIARKLLSLKNQTDALTQIKIRLNELEEVLHGVFLVKEVTPKSLDYIMSFGERLAVYTINKIAIDRGLKSTDVDTRDIILTDNTFGRAHVDFKKSGRMIKKLADDGHALFIVTGFIAATRAGEITTLGRGGSDYTASIFGAALGVKEIEIWTDVNGVMTADPTKVPDAFPIEQLSYEEAMELSHFGAKVIYPPTMQPALDRKIAIRVLNTLDPGYPGTLISRDAADSKHLIKGLSSIDHVCLLLVQGSGMIGVAGIAERIFNALAREHISIILISQASSEHSICLAVLPQDAMKAKKAVEQELRHELRDKQVSDVSIEKDKTIIAVVGENMRHRKGIAGKVFQALGNNGVNISAIAQGSSELNISMVIAREDETKALNTLHNAFFLAGTRTIHLYLVGTGLIGSALLELLQKQQASLAETFKLTIKVVGLANSSKMLFNQRGLDLQNWQEHLTGTGSKSDIELFLKQMQQFNLPSSVLVDCTASEALPDIYDRIFRANVSIITPNKKANARSFKFYQMLRESSDNNNVQFHYETNVGAALPVINTIKDLVNCGDHIRKIEGILSGTLSYIFNEFDDRQKFSDVVKAAAAKGYTEPDPREDLSGMDVARKLLILLREAGYTTEMSEINVKPLISQTVAEVQNVTKALAAMAQDDKKYQVKYREAHKAGKVLRYVARYNAGRAQVGLEALPKDHPLAELKATENMIAIYSDHYHENPLIIRGPGAGKDVTAAGVFADILRYANSMM